MHINRDVWTYAVEREALRRRRAHYPAHAEHPGRWSPFTSLPPPPPIRHAPDWSIIMETPRLRGYPVDSDLARLHRIERDARRARRSSRRQARRQARAQTERRISWLLR